MAGVFFRGEGGGWGALYGNKGGGSMKMNNVASSGETYHSFLFRISDGVAAQSSHALQALERS